ncbi:hypothetical protein [Euzebya rosea]|uniref:hypothetical protein n=1 Tax=Euzebya rosea TaxID=2052804 RepID=UPI000D3E4321|nr:hypothetical protein [Euzebya rosea]
MHGCRIADDLAWTLAGTHDDVDDVGVRGRMRELQRASAALVEEVMAVAMDDPLSRRLRAVVDAASDVAELLADQGLRVREGDGL